MVFGLPVYLLPESFPDPWTSLRQVNLIAWVVQACNLGHLVLRPHADASAASDKLEMLMAWQMAESSLANPVGGPIELCLAPLKLFLDASQLALSLGCPNAAAQAARDADSCFSELMKPLARQVRPEVLLHPQPHPLDAADRSMTYNECHSC